MDKKIIIFIACLTLLVLFFYLLITHIKIGNVDGEEYLVDKKGYIKNKFLRYLVFGLVLGAILILITVLRS